MRSLLAAFAALSGLMNISGGAIAQPVQPADASMGDRAVQLCTQDANVDSCWRAGVEAEKRGDAGATLAAYEASCAAGFQMGGCYEAGKIYFLSSKLRDYGKSKDRMMQVCRSPDIGIGPYACKYLGIIYRNGLSGRPRIDQAFEALSRACFTHNEEPFIDGNGCEILADNIPSADEMGTSEDFWQPDYVAYLALTRGCSDDMPALCDRALNIHRQAVGKSANWLARCAEDTQAVGFSGKCEDLARSASPAKFEQRQAFRRNLVRMFYRATEYAG
ncbi:MAG: hypothetical protein BGO57_14740 [Sphingomonadales bacterium 63-6]|nr:MAG: hypothetical protein BGO57_14740 [Sphingomonadales bacterium 63-6]